MPNQPLKNILYIEDDQGLARLLQKRMERLNFTLDIAYSAAEGMERMAQRRYDLILLDYHLPDLSGLDLLKKLHPVSEHPPIILLTVGGDERVAIKALELGAADYAVKDPNQFYLDLLPAVMQAAYTRDRLMRENEIQRQALERAIEQAERASMAKDDFLATMSHEIRTPMNAVVGLANILANTPLTPKQAEMVETLRTSADLLLKLINDLLDLSRIESGQVELEKRPFRLEPIFHDLQSMFAVQAKERGLRLDFIDDTGDTTFLGDKTRVQQMLINLVGNALKFTPQGGIEVNASLPGDGKVLTIRVKDSGIGIPQDKLDAIFGKFVQADQTITRRFGGSGLGLAICRTLSQAMGGGITVESEPGKGSVFTLSLQLNIVPAMPAKESASAEAAVDEGGGQVLLVEDYPANVMVASLMLENLGYGVDVANSGAEAVARVEAAQKPYHAILMDVQMQDMDGFETTRRIRQLETEKGFRHAIIGVTAHALAGDRERCLDAGMDDYMSKPIHLEILAQKLKKLSVKAA